LQKIECEENSLRQGIRPVALDWRNNGWFDANGTRRGSNVLLRRRFQGWQSITINENHISAQVLSHTFRVFTSAWVSTSLRAPHWTSNSLSTFWSIDWSRRAEPDMAQTYLRRLSIWIVAHYQISGSARLCHVSNPGAFVRRWSIETRALISPSHLIDSLSSIIVANGFSISQQLPLTNLCLLQLVIACTSHSQYRFLSHDRTTFQNLFIASWSHQRARLWRLQGENWLIIPRHGRCMRKRYIWW
jgi:hypothetical protein